MTTADTVTTPAPGFWAIGIITTAFADTLTLAQRDHFAASMKRTAKAFLDQGADTPDALEALTSEAEWVRRLASELMLSPIGT
jgi:hypothetical protein